MPRLPGWIEHDPFLAALSRRLRGYRPVRLTLAGFKQAAVLLVVWRQVNAPHLLFIRRSDHMRKHGGEISFPGGAWEPGDEDLSYTALRETHEEVGIPPDALTLLGRLDDAFSFSRYAIAPFVAALSQPHPLKPNEEVAEPIPLTLRGLFKPDRFSMTHRTLDGVHIPVYTYAFDQRVIWGATARILRGFLDLIRRDPALLEAMQADAPDT